MPHVGGFRLATAFVVVGALLLTSCSEPTAPAPRVTSAPEVRTRASTPGSVGTSTISLFHATHFDGAWVPERGPTFAQYAAVIRAARNELPIGRGSLFLGNGDDIADVVDNVSTGGLLSIEAFNAAGLDAETYGFDELAFGLDRLAALLPRARYQCLSANVRDEATGSVYGRALGAREWVIRNVGGMRVGLTGVIAAGAREPWGQWSSAGVEIVDPVAALGEVVPDMRAEGAQLVIVLSHLDNDEARRAAREVDGITAILGTHCCEPIIPPEIVEGTVISAPPWGLGGFGRLDATIRDGRIVGHQHHSYEVPATTTPDPAIQAVFDKRLGG